MTRNKDFLCVVLVQISEACAGAVLWNKAVFKNFAIFTGKHMCLRRSLQAEDCRPEDCDFLKSTKSEKHLQTAASDIQYFGRAGRGPF